MRPVLNPVHLPPERAFLQPMLQLKETSTASLSTDRLTDLSDSLDALRAAMSAMTAEHARVKRLFEKHVEAVRDIENDVLVNEVLVRDKSFGPEKQNSEKNLTDRLSYGSDCSDMMMEESPTLKSTEGGLRSVAWAATKSDGEQSAADSDGRTTVKATSAENVVKVVTWSNDVLERKSSVKTPDTVAADRHRFSGTKASFAAGLFHGTMQAVHAKGWFRQTKTRSGSDTILGSTKGVFPDAESMKHMVRQAINRPEASVTDYYHVRGFCQHVARSNYFELFTFLMIALNSLWLAFEVSMNEEDVLVHSHWTFQVVEHLFCLAFCMEWIVRFLAFKRKRDTLKDSWFLFDTVLVLAMVLETWIFTCIVLLFNIDPDPDAGWGTTYVLRAVRTVRITRVARVGRLFRAFPEMMLIIRSLAIVIRTVSLIIFVLTAIIYIYAIMFTQLCRGTKLNDSIFSNVPTAMWSLTLGAIFPDMAELTEDLGAVSSFFAFLFLSFTVLSTIIVMNMLIGALVEVVGVVAAVERETNEVSAVKEELHNIMVSIGADSDHDGSISRQEFNQAMQEAGAIQALHKVGVDALGLVETADIVFSNRVSFKFEELLDLLLNLRANNATKVKDLTDMRRYLHADICRMEVRLERKFDRQIARLSAKKPGPRKDVRIPEDGAEDEQSDPREVRVCSTTSGGDDWDDAC